MQMVRTSYLYFAPGTTVLVGVLGGYMGMIPPYFFGSGTATGLDLLSDERHF